MGAFFRSEEVCLVQLFLQSGSAYNCVSELGELGLVEFRDVSLNNKVVKVLRSLFTYLEMEIARSLSPPLTGPLPSPVPYAPQPRELMAIEEESERLARDLREVRCPNIQNVLVANEVPYVGNRLSFGKHSGPLFFTGFPSFVAGVVHPWKVPSFERLLWRACRGYIIVDFREMEERLELPDTGEVIQWTVFLISYWGEQIGQKVKKICDCFHTRTFVYPEGAMEREDILDRLQGRILELKTVLSQTEDYLQQLVYRSVAALPQWKVSVQKCKAVQAVLNQCSPSVTDKCLIAEAWCPVRKLLLLQRGGQGRIQDLDAYGVASYREVNPALYTIITFPFLFAVMFGDVGHGLLMTTAALWMVLQERDPKLRASDNEIFQMMFGGRYLILLMGLFSVYTGAVYNECFSKGLSPFPSGWHIQPMFQHYNWSDETLKGNRYLTLDPNVTGVFLGPYPFGIDPIWRLANNHLTFLNSYKMKMSVIIGVIHMTFGVCLSFFNYIHFNQLSSVFLVLIPELLFLLCLFGYLVFMVVYKWLVFGPRVSDRAPSILIHFIDMFLFAENKDNPPLYNGQMIVQKVLVVVALASVPVLLLGKPLYLYYNHRRRANGERCILNRNITAPYKQLSLQDFDTADVFMHQAIHTIEYCLGCISNTASYLRLWALSLAHAQLSEVLWVMVMRVSLSWQGYVGSVVLVVVFSFFATLTVSILLIMEGLSAFLHALRLHWVEFQNKFYSGAGYKLHPFSFSTILNPQ
uniref:V-type proton ATPase subunit a n=1 Tax=Esox lucius TaxID=8010 RepID=A0AAY5K8X4_ESOLU